MMPHPCCPQPHHGQATFDRQSRPCTTQAALLTSSLPCSGSTGLQRTQSRWNEYGVAAAATLLASGSMQQGASQASFMAVSESTGRLARQLTLQPLALSRAVSVASHSSSPVVSMQAQAQGKDACTPGAGCRGHWVRRTAGSPL